MTLGGKDTAGMYPTGKRPGDQFGDVAVEIVTRTKAAGPVFLLQIELPWIVSSHILPNELR